MEKHVPNLLMAFCALAVFAGLLFLSRLVRPDRKSDVSKQAFSSGESPVGSPWVRVSVRYQTLMVIAALFFIGILVFFPAVASFRRWIADGKGPVALAVTGIFLGTLSVALAHAWRKGDLSWIRDVERANEVKEDNGTVRERIT